MRLITKVKSLYWLLLICIIAGCNAHNSNASGDSVVKNFKNIPQERLAVSTSPVKTYSEITKSFETTDTFKVDLFETKQMFRYLIKITYKQLDGEDTLRVPDFGINPTVEIKKSEKRPSCIVGFLDEHKQFRESKLVSFEDNEIKVHVLKHYAVATYQDTVK